MAEQSPQPAPAEVDSPSIEDRLASYVSAPEPEVAEEDAPAEVESAEIEQPAVGDDFAEVEADDGSTVRVPAKIKDQLLRWKDYTQKTQHAATMAEKAQDAIQFAEAQQQIMAVVAQEIGEYRAIESELQKFNNVDWSAIYNADPGQALRLQDQRTQLKERLAGMAQAIQGKAAHVRQITEQHQSRQWQLAEKGVLDVLGNVTPEDNVAMLRSAQALGFTDKELKGRFADARVLHAIYKAAKWDQLQAGKSGALNAVSKAPPVVKPGAARGPGAAETSKYKDQRVQLKKSGSVEDAARLLARFK